MSNLLATFNTVSSDFPQTGCSPEAQFESGSVFDRKCSEAELLQHMLEVESSRHRLERYARDLSRLAELSANATLEAKQIAQQKGDLVATLSHEMRTPLNGILGMVHLLQSRQLDPEAQGYVEVIRQAGESLLSLVDSVLDLAKIDAGKLQLHMTRFRVRQATAEALRITQHAAESKGLKLSCQVADDIPAEIDGDALRLRQILLNLLSNAIKFSQQGTVTLTVEAAPADPGKRGLRFTVTDNGIGISPAAQARLFQRFSQADSSISSQFGGTGLGLAICKSLTELMGGSIGLKSEPGVGSSFWFTIQVPAGDISAPETDVSERSSAPALAIVPSESRSLAPAATEPRILLVEDNLINQKVALLIMKKFGYTASVAENGRKALDVTAENQFDLILMDCLMPEMDGLQATRAIRQHSKWGAEVPIIAITANAFAKDREACLEAGMSDYLSKPIREAALRSMLDKWLPARQPDAFAETAVA